jgi:hypothetical protein
MGIQLELPFTGYCNACKSFREKVKTYRYRNSDSGTDPDGVIDVCSECLHLLKKSGCRIIADMIMTNWAVRID